MLETIIVWAIILVCVVYIGKKFIKQYKGASNKDSSLDCGGGCSCCSVSQCSDKEK